MWLGVNQISQDFPSCTGIVAELGALFAEVDALKRLQAETVAKSDAPPRHPRRSFQRRIMNCISKLCWCLHDLEAALEQFATIAEDLK